MAINQQGGMLAMAGAPQEPPMPQGQEPPMPQGQEPPMPQGQPAPQGQEQSQGIEPANAEEQEYYNRVVMASMRVVFESDKSRETIVKRLKAQKDQPAKSLADTASILMIQLDQKVDNKIPETVVIPAAVEMLEQVASLADSLNLYPIDDAVLNHAAQLMIQSLGEHYGVQPEEIQQMLDGMDPEALQQIVDQQGNFARKQPQVQNGEA
jgi:hypothetical protein